MDWYGPGTRCWDRFDSQKFPNPYRSDPGSSTCSLSGQLLATCQSIYQEISNILYGENTFGLHIYILEGLSYGGNEKVEVETSFFEGFEINDLDSPWPAPKLHLRGTETPNRSRIRYSFAVDKIRRLRLVLNPDSECNPASHMEYSWLKHVLHFVCQRIKALPLNHLNVDLHSRYPMTRYCILDPLRALRGISEVTFEPEPQNPRLIQLRNRFHVRSPAAVRKRPKRDRLLATLLLQVANYLKQLLESSTPVDSSLLQALSFQLVATYLRMTEASSPVEKHLRLLYGDHQTYGCFEGPYEACNHPSDDDLFKYEKQIVSDNEFDESEDESGWESRSNEDEVEGDELEGDELE